MDTKKECDQVLSDEESEKISAINRLKNQASSIPILLDFMCDESESVASSSVDRLKKVSSSETVYYDICGEDQDLPFGDNVVDYNEIVHYGLIDFLSPIYDYLNENIIPETTLQKLVGIIYSNNQTVRVISLFTLTCARYEAVINELMLIAALEEDDLVREVATWGLSEFSRFSSNSTLLNSLITASNDLIGNVRYQALKGLTFYETEEVLEIIIRMIDHPSAKIVKLAIEELGRRHQDAAFEALTKAFASPGRKSRHSNRNLFKAYIIKSISSHQRPDVERFLIDTLSLPKYARAFEGDGGSGKYVVAMCLRGLSSHGTLACINVVKPFAEFNETVRVPTCLSSENSYWPIDVGKEASEIIGRLKSAMPNRKTG